LIFPTRVEIAALAKLTVLNLSSVGFLITLLVRA
jgi:hypothetical protein